VTINEFSYENKDLGSIKVLWLLLLWHSSLLTEKLIKSHYVETNIGKLGYTSFLKAIVQGYGFIDLQNHLYNFHTFICYSFLIKTAR
jgi:hypothetical protein